MRPTWFLVIDAPRPVDAGGIAVTVTLKPGAEFDLAERPSSPSCHPRPRLHLSHCHRSPITRPQGSGRVPPRTRSRRRRPPSSPASITASRTPEPPPVAPVTTTLPPHRRMPPPRMIQVAPRPGRCGWRHPVRSAVHAPAFRRISAIVCIHIPGRLDRQEPPAAPAATTSRRSWRPGMRTSHEGYTTGEIDQEGDASHLTATDPVAVAATSTLRASGCGPGAAERLAVRCAAMWPAMSAAFRFDVRPLVRTPRRYGRSCPSI